MLWEHAALLTAPLSRATRPCAASGAAERSAERSRCCDLLHNRCQRSEPWRRPRVQSPHRRRGPWRGGQALVRAQGQQRLSRGQPVSMGDNVAGEGRAAHAGSAWQRPTTEQTRDEGCGCGGRRGQGVQPRAQPWAGCPPLGRDTRAARLCWRAPAAKSKTVAQARTKVRRADPGSPPGLHLW
jgi:hypothetical protein